MIKKVKYWIRNFFGFSKIETNGFIGLLLVILFVLLIPIVFEFFNASTYTSSLKDKLLLDSLAYQLEQKKNDHKQINLTVALNPFPFNPNEAGLETFSQLGLPDEVGKRIINYRKAGGSFKVKSDFNKIYGLQQEVYDQLYAFILLPEKLALPAEGTSKQGAKRTFIATDINKKEKVPIESFKFDINTCDTATLKRIYGIGPVLAERIVKYRSLIGGYITKEQLSEVYGLKEEVLQNLYEKAYIESTFIPERVSINSANVETMAAHPYISFNLAKAIYAYRNQHGDFKSTETLLNIHVLDSTTFVKLKPYIAL